ncbi:MAG: zinc ribbon domain-containing protein [Oscillospiraceae bacterium]|nr:zinc ribbon domain-containing protein [Oscillospiraceae bacterium]
MAEEKTCDYCGTHLAPGDEICPSCGAPNPHHVPGGEAGTRKPRTIEELRAFCDSKGMPLEKMRFFIGINEPSPRAFGIYREGDRFIVYKNKSDGSRAVRYDGPDEAYAVNELYLKLLEEHRLRKNGGGSGSTRSSGDRRRPKRSSTIIIIAVVVLYFLLQLVIGRLSHRKDGYYSTGDNLYYRYGSSWYVDSDYYDDWVETDSFPMDDYGSYYVGDDYDDSWGASDFTDSDAWDSLQDSDSDSDWDADYDSWDSGDTDWDSDW